MSKVINIAGICFIIFLLITIGAMNIAASEKDKKISDLTSEKAVCENTILQSQLIEKEQKKIISEANKKANKQRKDSQKGVDELAAKNLSSKCELAIKEGIMEGMRL